MTDYANVQNKGHGMLYFTCGSNPDNVLMRHLCKFVNRFNESVDEELGEDRLTFEQVSDHEFIDLNSVNQVHSPC